METVGPPLRSLLFCPATEPRRTGKLPSTGADAVALDLEDAVHEGAKSSAREAANRALDSLADVRAYVRVNHPDTGRMSDDIAAVVHRNLDGIVLPKVGDPATVQAAAGELAEAERRATLPVGSVKLLILIESAQGVERATEILASDERVETAIFGFVDFMVDVGIDSIDHLPGAEELLYARSKVVVAARAARKRGPLDGPFLDISADEPFTEQCRQGRRLGFKGKMLIHPRQVELSHAGFAPSAEEVAAAHRIIEEFELAEAAGSAAVVVDGRLVDYPVVTRARRIVAAALTEVSS